MIKLLYEGFQEDDIEFHYYMGADLHGFLEDNLLKNLRKQLQEVCDKENVERKSYYIDISAGFCKFCLRDLGRILQIIERADQDLYDDKKNRRPDIRKINHT